MKWLAVVARAMFAAPLPVTSLLLFALPSPSPAQTAETCLTCHGDPSLTMQKKGETVRLGVDASALGSSVHKDVACVDCHAGFDPGAFPHKAKIAPVNCMECHSDARETHRFHAAMHKATGSDGPRGASCKECHGTHDVASLKAAGSPFHPSNLAASCGRCHEAIGRPYLESSHGRALAQGIRGAPTCMTCHEKPLTRARSGAEAPTQEAERKIAQEKVCLSCHLEDPEVRARMGPQAGFIAAYEKSVHGAALLKGNGAAANCVDCHGAHEMRRGFEPTARVNKLHIPETCGACHRGIAETYAGSVHGVAITRGNTDAPVCTDCHGEHNILKHTDPNAPVAAANVSAQVCSPCHSSVRLSQKYGIATDRFKSFSDSYHGLAIRGGSVQVANCASCHGFHDIRRSDDPASSINKTNLAATCGKCHPGANARFAVGAVHVVMSEEQEPLLYWIATIYVVIIMVVVGGMLAHNVLDYLKKLRLHHLMERGRVTEGPVGHALYLRMTLSERLQHGALLVSFTVLVITGFMLSYPDAWWVAGLRRLSDRLFDLRSLLHRVAAVVMVLASVFHLYYLAFTARGREFLRDMLPLRRDFTDAVGAVLYYLGQRTDRPRCGRFGYVEKAEYWALVWGTVVMTATGVVLWFENTFIGLLTKLGYDVARTIHFYEAWLATLAILVWHIYFVIFNPDVYPMNTAWLTGHLGEKEMAEDHPLELEAIRTRRTP